MKGENKVDTTISKPVKVVAISAAIIVLVLVNLIVFMVPQHEQYNVISIEDSMPNWILAETFTLGSMYSPDPAHHPPKVLYFSDDNRFQLLNPEIGQKPIDPAFRNGKGVNGQKCDDLWYAPNLSVEGNKLSFDYFVYNRAGIDCRQALLNITLSILKVNLSTGKYNEDYITEIPVEDLEITDLPVKEIKKYRMTTELIKPEIDEIYVLRYRFNWPAYFTDYNNEKIMMKDFCIKCNSLDGLNKDIYIFGEDAPAIPTMIYDKK